MGSVIGSMRDAVTLWRRGNDAGLGYAPYCDEPGEDTIEEAVAAAERDGWTVVMPATSYDEITVLQDADGGLMGIGGDGSGRGAWAVDLDTAATIRVQS